MKFFIANSLGPTRKLTPQGFLLCLDVPIARVGEQLYGKEEMNDGNGNYAVASDDAGVVRIMREESEVFRPETIESFQGMPVVNDHPGPEYPESVTADNWSELAVGTVFNVRRGADEADGTKSPLLMADLLIAKREAIEDVLAGKTEVSCGYDATYVDDGGGRGRQTGIFGNHLALVDKARCGAICSIGDNVGTKILEGATDMVKNALCAIKAAFASKDEKAFNAAIDAIPTGAMRLLTTDAEEGVKKWGDAELEKKFAEYDSNFENLKKSHETDHKSVMDAIGEIGKRLAVNTPGDAEKEAEKKEEEKEAKDMEGELEEEAPSGATGDAVRKATDSQYLEESFDATKSTAEIIAPGIHLPSFDRAAKPIKTFKDICGLRRKALQFAIGDAATNALIQEARGGKELTADALKAMPCGNVRTLFSAVGVMKAAANTRDSVRRADRHYRYQEGSANAGRNQRGQRGILGQEVTNDFCEG